MKNLARCGLLVLLIAVSPLAFAQGGSSGGSGGDIVKMRFRLAAEQAFKLFYYCASQGRCRLTAEELELSQSLFANRGREKIGKDTFVYKSGKAEPGFFIIDHEEKIAKTDTAYGSVIYINLDLIRKKNAFGDLEPMSYSEVMQVVVHEFGHHTGSRDERLLDSFGAKYALLAKRFGYSSALGFGADMIRTMSLNANDMGMRTEITDHPVPSYGSLIIEDYGAIYDISRTILGPIEKRTGIEVTYVDGAPAKKKTFLSKTDVIPSVQFYNLHWDEVMEPLFRKRPTTIRLKGVVSLFGWAENEQGWDMRYIMGDISFTIAFEVYESSINVLTIKPETVRLESLVSTQLARSPMGHVRPD